MATTVRATCPGCQSVLRIPLEWVDKSVKCKKCGGIVRAKAQPLPSPTGTTSTASGPTVIAVSAVAGRPLPIPAPPAPPKKAAPVVAPKPAASPPVYGPPSGVPAQAPPGHPQPPGYPYAPPPGYPYAAPPPGYGYAPPPGYPQQPSYPYAPPLGYPTTPGYPPAGYGYPPQVAPPGHPPHQPPPGYPGAGEGGYHPAPANQNAESEFADVPISFESSRPSGNATCSDDSCPCPGATIAPGTGYLYISEEVIEFRKDAIAESEAAAKIQDVQRKLGAIVFNPNLLASPILMCRMGAEKRGIDLAVASRDAQHWWKTGQVPLRPTLMAGQAASAHAAVESSPKAPWRWQSNAMRTLALQATGLSYTEAQAAIKEENAESEFADVPISARSGRRYKRRSSGSKFVWLAVVFLFSGGLVAGGIYGMPYIKKEMAKRNVDPGNGSPTGGVLPKPPKGTQLSAEAQNAVLSLVNIVVNMAEVLAATRGNRNVDPSFALMGQNDLIERAAAEVVKFKCEREAVVALLKIISDRRSSRELLEQTVCSNAVRALGYFGPKATDAAPMLAELVNHHDNFVADEAKDSLKKIQFGGTDALVANKLDIKGKPQPPQPDRESASDAAKAWAKRMLVVTNPRDNLNKRLNSTKGDRRFGDAINAWREALKEKGGDDVSFLNFLIFFTQLEPVFEDHVFQPERSDKFVQRIQSLPADASTAWQELVNQVAENQFDKNTTICNLIQIDRLFRVVEFNRAEFDLLKARAKTLPADSIKTLAETLALGAKREQAFVELLTQDWLYRREGSFNQDIFREALGYLTAQQKEAKR